MSAPTYIFKRFIASDKNLCEKPRAVSCLSKSSLPVIHTIYDLEAVLDIVKYFRLMHNGGLAIAEETDWTRSSTAHHTIEFLGRLLHMFVLLVGSPVGQLQDLLLEFKICRRF
jgi:hypothetical protein